MPSALQAELSQLSQPFHIGEICHFMALHLIPCSMSMSLLYCGVQNWTQHSRCGPTSAINVLPNAAQDTTGVLCGKGPLLADVQPGVHQDLWVLFRKACLQVGGSKHMLVPEVVPPYVQDFAFLLVEHHDVPVSPLLQPVKVPLDGSMILSVTLRNSRFCVNRKLAKGTTYPIIKTISEDVK